MSAPKFMRPRPESSFHMIAISSRGNGSECAICHRTASSPQSALQVAADELLDAAKPFIVGHLNRWMLGKICGRRMQHPADTPVERNLAAADRVDSYASRVRRIFDREVQINFHRNIAKEAACHANEC